MAKASLISLMFWWVLLGVATGLGVPAQAASSRSVSISNNSGGVIVQFAMQVAEFREAGTLVKFSGRCDSSCTLFLSLPRSQTCISEGAYFRFHAPMARSARTARVARAYMMDQYPEWVRAWIHHKGGLSRRLVKMDYAYASQFLPSCERIALRRT